jgi:hypothetical protein
VRIERCAGADRAMRRRVDGQRPAGHDRVRDDLVSVPVEDRGGRPAVEAVVACAHCLPAEVVSPVGEREAGATRALERSRLVRSFGNGDDRRARASMAASATLAVAAEPPPSVSASVAAIAAVLGGTRRAGHPSAGLATAAFRHVTSSQGCAAGGQTKRRTATPAGRSWQRVGNIHGGSDRPDRPRRRLDAALDRAVWTWRTGRTRRAQG